MADPALVRQPNRVTATLALDSRRVDIIIYVYMYIYGDLRESDLCTFGTVVRERLVISSGENDIYSELYEL